MKDVNRESRPEVLINLSSKCISTTCHPLELLHMDLVGPMLTESIGGKKSILALVDSFSWVSFLHDKSEAFKSKCAINVQ